MGDAITDLISTYLTIIAFLVSTATFILGFFMILEFDKKLKDKMKKYYRILVMSLIVPSAIMNSNGIYLIISTRDHLSYLMALISIYIPITVLSILMTKKMV